MVLTLGAALCLPHSLPAQRNSGENRNNHRSSQSSRPQNRSERNNGNRSFTNSRKENKSIFNRQNNNINRGRDNNNNGRPQGVRQGYNNNNGRPQGMRPGYNHNNGRPRGMRPDYNHNNGRPQGMRPGYRPRPHAYRPVPHVPHHGWGWGRPLPPRPPRPRYYRTNAPLISFGLGLAYGALFDTSIGALINAGLNVAAAVNNVIYITDVARYGVNWPNVSVYYNNGAMSGARYQYGSSVLDTNIYNSVYNQLCAAYGAPVSIEQNGTTRTATWWGGGNTGYISLQLDSAYDDLGQPVYYTDLIYGQ